MRNRLTKLIFCFAIVVTAMHAESKQYRSHQAIAEFKREQPCPANGNKRGPCPGYVIDHIKPLCASGEDHPSNMQWQTLADSKIKDKEEWKLCRSMK